MVSTTAKPITLEDFLQLPETKPASEYIDGQVFQKPMPKTDHGILQTDLAAAITASLRPGKAGRAITELRCTFDGRSIVPDIVVLPWSAIPRGEDGKALAEELWDAPVWMIEILSAGQKQTKVVEKILHALEHGTQLGWLIDPEEECVFVYTPELKVLLCKLPEQQIPVPDFAKGFELTVGTMVSWLYD